jgi:hypothetical protein
VAANTPIIATSDSCHTANSYITDSESYVSREERLHRLEEQFGSWSGKDAQGQPETETWIGQVPGVLYRSVLVNGLIVLTDRRLCYLAYLPTFDKGQIIRVSLKNHISRDLTYINLSAGLILLHRADRLPLKRTVDSVNVGDAGLN